MKLYSRREWRIRGNGGRCPTFTTKSNPKQQSPQHTCNVTSSYDKPRLFALLVSEENSSSSAFMTWNPNKSERSTLESPEYMLAKGCPTLGQPCENEDCGVCHEATMGFQDGVRLPCQHTFHRSCVEVWLTQSPTCPMCRCAVVRNNISGT